MTAIVQLSGGVTSYVAAKFILEEKSPDDVVLLFADTRYEDDDLYRFLDDVSKRLNMSVTRVCEGRTPWQVFFDEGMIGNTRADLCSRILKREPLAAWCEANADPTTDEIIVGFDATEPHRLDRMANRLAPWRVRAPLIERNIWKQDAHRIGEADGIRLPHLYSLGFEHNNCGGRCIKAGQAVWSLLYRTRPDAFAEVEENEQRFRSKSGKNVAILRDRVGGSTKPLTLKALRDRIESQPELIDMTDYGACSCMDPINE